MFKAYLQQIFSKAKSGEARKSTVGIPDFKVQTDKNLLIGYIEAKDLGRNLERLTKGEQERIEKYKKRIDKFYPKVERTLKN